MVMRPTHKKLRLALTAIAALQALISYELVFAAMRPGGRPAFIFGLLGVVFALVNLYLAFSLKKLLPDHTRRVVGLTIASVLWMGTAFIFAVGGLRDPRGYMLFGAMVFAWYTVRNLKRAKGDFPTAEVAKEDLPKQKA